MFHLERYIRSVVLAALPPQPSLRLKARRKRSRSESMTGTTMIITTGTLTKTTCIGTTWRNITGVMSYTASSTKACSDTIGSIVTHIRTVIEEGGYSESLKRFNSSWTLSALRARGC
jgi:hypothetical protein